MVQDLLFDFDKSEHERFIAAKCKLHLGFDRSAYFTPVWVQRHQKNHKQLV